MKNYYDLIFKKLFLIYVVYMLLFATVSYSASYIYTRNNYIKAEQNRMEQLTSKLESHLSSSLDIASIFSRHESIIQYSQHTDSISSANAAKVCNDISAPLLLNQIYSSVAVINVPLGHVVMPTGTLSYSYFKNSYGLSNTEIDTHLNMLYSANKSNSMVLTANTSSNGSMGRPLIACLISVPTVYEKPVICIFIYDLAEFFKSSPQTNIPSTTELYMKRNGIFISYSDKKPGIFSFEDSAAPKFSKKVASSQMYSNYWGEIGGALYVPYFSYFAYLNSFILLILLVFIVIAFIGYAFVRTNTTAMYSPIKKLTKMLPSDYINDSDDIGAFENYVSSLVDQKNIMSEIISETKIELADKFLLNLMTRTLSKSQVTDGIVSYNLSGVSFPLICFIITYRNYGELKDILSTDGLNEVRVTVHEIIEESLRQKSFYKLLDTDAQTIAAIASADGSEDFADLLKKAALNVEMMLDIDLVIFMGNTAYSWYEISNSYNSALASKNNYMIISDQNIVIKPGGEKSRTVAFNSASENELISAVTAADINLAADCISRIVDRNMKDASLTREQFSSFVVMLYSTVIRLISSMGKTENELFGDKKIYLELIGCSDAETLKSTLIYFIAAIIQSITNTQKNIADSVANRTLSYVEDNYNHDISLYTLADYLNVSQSYASKIFKQQTGENFKDYLTNVRLKKAVELMEKNPRMKIGDIAESVGYTSFSLSRAFTKKYGKSPSDYIKELQ